MTLSVRSFTHFVACALAASTTVAPARARADPPGFLDRAVVAAATRRAITRAGLTPDSTRSMASRARSAGALPTLTVRVMRGIGASAAQTDTLDHYASDDSFVLGVRARFELDRLVFDRSEVALERIELARAERRDAIEREVIELLATLTRSYAAQEGADPESPAMVEHQIVSLRAQARLEALTGERLDAILRAR